jgi:hypothetical protein
VARTARAVEDVQTLLGAAHHSYDAGNFGECASALEKGLVISSVNPAKYGSVVCGRAAARVLTYNPMSGGGVKYLTASDSPKTST